MAADGTIRYLSRHADERVFRGNGVFGMAADGGHRRPLAALPRVQEKEHEEAEVFARAETAVWAPGASAWAFGHDEPTGQRLLVGLGDGRATWDATGLVEDLHQLAWGQ